MMNDEITEAELATMKARLDATTPPPWTASLRDAITGVETVSS
jgi:hypothetical protein